MDFSAANVQLWRPMIQFGIIAALILASNILCRKIKWIRSCLLPTSVLAGFLLLLLRSFHVLPIDTGFLEAITYHALALGFIALSLRVPERHPVNGALHGAKNGALIVSTYLVQALVGLVISLALAYTFFPNLFAASGILLPMVLLSDLLSSSWVTIKLNSNEKDIICTRRITCGFLRKASADASGRS
jgi:ESS family glutamate:Na+ symporter